MDTNDIGQASSRQSQLSQNAGDRRLIANWSIEVMPRTAAKIADFRSLLPAGTRVYIAHIDGTATDEMVATARRLNREGFQVMPHIPARSIADRAMLDDLLDRYRHEADVGQALLLAGGNAQPRGQFTSSLDLVETGLFDAMGFTDLHFAGHPEGNREIDRDASSALADTALVDKQAFADRTAARVALTTQFAFDAKSIIGWSERIADLGIDLPIHVGLAGPAKLQTLVKYALSCGVGPSLKILQKRALDVTRLLVPYEPTDLLEALEAHKASHPASLLDRVHVFPLGGIEPAVAWCRRQASRA